LKMQLIGEKEIKRLDLGKKKVDLIEKINPNWLFLNDVDLRSSLLGYKIV